MELTEWQDLAQNAQLRADTHERKAGIKRRYYDRQLGLMEVTDLTLTLSFTHLLPLIPIFMSRLSGRVGHTAGKPCRGAGKSGKNGVHLQESEANVRG